MVVENSNFADENRPIEEPSKSQRKRDADAIRALGMEIAALSNNLRAQIPIPDAIRQSIDLLNRTSQHGARKRQLGFIAKQLRQIDLAATEAALDTLRNKARAHTQRQHIVEGWRDRLLGLADDESSSDALTTFFNHYPSADRQQLRQLQRNGIAEREKNKPPKSARHLFQVIRTIIDSETDDAESLDDFP